MILLLAHLDFENYISLFNRKPTDKLKASDLYEEYYDSVIYKLEDKISKAKKEAEKQKLQTKLQEYKTTIPDLSDLIDIELNKISMYLLNDGINTVVISAGESKDDVADFLGYKFSKRKGDEGLKELTDKAIKELDSYTKRETIDSKLYNPNIILDSDKVNYYIYNNLLKGELSEEDLELMHEKMKKMKYCALNELFEYDTLEFDETIGMERKKKRKYESRYSLIKLKKIENISIDKGDGAPQGKKYFKDGIYPFIRAGNLNDVDDNGYIIPDKDNYINEQAVRDCKLKLHKKGTILFPVSGKSIDTSMGLTPLGGIPMGSRSGDLDPSIVEFIANKENLTASQVLNILNNLQSIQKQRKYLSCIIQNLLKVVYNKKYDLVAIIQEEWEKIKEEYIKNIKSGKKYEYIEIKESKKKNSKNTELQNSVESIFGSDYITM